MRLSLDSACAFLRFQLCAVSAFAVFAAAPLSVAHAQTSAQVELASLEAVSDERFLDALERLQQQSPGEARGLANAAKAQRPHLAAQIDEMTAVVAGPDYSLALALGVGVATATAIITSQGGQSGQGNQPAQIETILPPLPPGWETNPALWETGEYNVDYSKSQINASAAYARGGTGAGIKVGLFDGGIDATHPEFAGRIGGCFDVGSGTAVCTDPDTHGTHVAGSIGAARDGNVMHGVAFDAELYSVRLFASAGAFLGTSARISAAADWAIANGVRVINHSWGRNGDHVGLDPVAVYNSYSDPADGDAFRKLLADNIIQVWATGNNGASQPSMNVALPHYAGFEDLKPLWVGVTSVNPDGSLASYAQQCGVAASWCLAAPGGTGGFVDQIISTDVGGGYTDLRGTSMATPQVTGALAVLLQLFGPGTVSNLTPQQIVQVMFRTADKNLPGYATSLDADGLSTMYGHGLLDLDAATTPDVYRMSVAGHALNGSRFVLGGALGGSLGATLDQRSLAVFDDLGRGITVDLAAFAAEAGTRFDYNAALRRLGQPGAQEIQFAPGMTLTLRAANDADQFLPGSSDISISTELVEGTYLQTGINTAPAHALGFFSQGDLTPGHLIDPSALSAPYLGLTDSATMSGIHTELWGGDLKVLAFGGKADTRSTSPLGALGLPESWTYGTAGEWTTSFGDAFSLSVRGGMVSETHELLGSRFTGAFGLDGATTSFAGAGVRVGITPNIDLIGSYDIGVSGVSIAQGSLFTHVDPIVSDAFSLGVISRGVFSKQDQFGFIVSQPMRVSAGNAALSLPQGRNADGSLAYAPSAISLTPTGQELRLQAFYTTPAMEGHLGLGAMLRLEPDHVAGANPDFATMANFRRPF